MKQFSPMHAFVVCCVVATLLGYACTNPNRPTPGSSETRDISMHDLVRITGGADTISANHVEAWRRCGRPLPLPVLDTIKLAAHDFQRGETPQVALERGVITLDTFWTDSVFIRHWGCQEEAFTYRFATQRFEGDSRDVVYWYHAALSSLEELQPCQQVPYDQPALHRALLQYLQKGNPATRMYADSIRFSESCVFLLHGVQKEPDTHSIWWTVLCRE